MDTNILRKGVTEIIRKMEKGTTEIFPIEQDVATDTAIRRLHRAEIRKGRRWERIVNLENFTITVNRIA